MLLTPLWKGIFSAGLPRCRTFKLAASGRHRWKELENSRGVVCEGVPFPPGSPMARLDMVTHDSKPNFCRVRQFVRLRGGVWPNRTDSWVSAAEPLLVRVFGFASVRNETRENRLENNSTSGDSEHVMHFPSPLRPAPKSDAPHLITPLFAPRCRQMRCGGGGGSKCRGYWKVVRGVAVRSAGMVDPGIDGLEMRAG
jgi:hypothetical protein